PSAPSWSVRPAASTDCCAWPRASACRPRPSSTIDHRSPRMPRILASSALQRFRVLDLSRVRAGPTCVRMLADFGADVIRVEPPPGIDPNEAMFAADRWSGDFQNLNRNKRSLTLNLKKPEGREVFRR